MGISLIHEGLAKGYHLKKEGDQLLVEKDKKSCCFSKFRLQQIQEERFGINNAIGVYNTAIRNHSCKEETEKLYLSLNRRYKALSRGFFWRLLAFMFFRAHSRELKLLRQEYSKFLGAFPKKDVIGKIAKKFISNGDSKHKKSTHLENHQPKSNEVKPSALEMGTEEDLKKQAESFTEECMRICERLSEQIRLLEGQADRNEERIRFIRESIESFREAHQEWEQEEEGFSYQIIPNGGKFVNFGCLREDVSKNFVEILLNFSEQINEDTSNLRIKFVGERGYDVGGLSRGFIAQLFTIFSEKCLLEGYPSFDKASMFFKNRTDAVFFAIGTILAFILRTNGRYPIGNIFALRAFESLKNCTDAMIEKSYVNLSYSELTTLCCSDLRNSIELNKLDAFFSGENEPSEELLKAVKMFYERASEEFLDSLDLTELRCKTQAILVEFFQDQLRPIHAIARGFRKIKAIWEALSNLDVKFIEKIICGITKRNNLLNNLTYSISLPETHRVWLEKWIRAAKKEKVIYFIQFVTGAPSLSQGQKIHIEASHGDALAAHACGPQLDLPLMIDEHTLWEMLDKLEDGKLDFSMI